MAFSCDSLGGRSHGSQNNLQQKKWRCETTSKLLCYKEKAALSCFRISIRLIGINRLFVALTDAEMCVQKANAPAR